MVRKGSRVQSPAWAPEIIANKNRSAVMKRLVLKEKDKKITGLCAGIAEYFNIDVTIVRLIVIVLTLTTWLIPMVLAYLIASSITPKEGEV